MTRAAPSSHWGRASPKLRGLEFWLWKVKRVYLVGDAVPHLLGAAPVPMYEAHLFHPTGIRPWTSKRVQTWDITAPQLLYTLEEKAEQALGQKARRAGRGAPSSADHERAQTGKLLGNMARSLA